MVFLHNYELNSKSNIRNKILSDLVYLKIFLRVKFLLVVFCITQFDLNSQFLPFISLLNGPRLPLFDRNIDLFTSQYLRLTLIGDVGVLIFRYQAKQIELRALSI